MRSLISAPSGPAPPITMCIPARPRRRVAASMSVSRPLRKKSRRTVERDEPVDGQVEPAPDRGPLGRVDRSEPLGVGTEMHDRDLTPRRQRGGRIGR